MTTPRYAKLNKEDISKLQTLEKDLGKIVLAIEPDRESPYAQLTEDQVERLRRLEMEWDVVLIAYNRK